MIIESIQKNSRGGLMLENEYFVFTGTLTTMTRKQAQSQKSGLAPSRSEARRNVEQGGVSVDGAQVKDIRAVYTKAQLSGDGIVVKRGKKNFKRIVLK